MFILKNIMAKYKREKKPLYIAFVDFKQAFDTEWHKCDIWCICNELGVIWSISHKILTIITRSCIIIRENVPDLSTKWISPQIHKKYTGVYFELIRSLLATFYASLTIIGASDVRDWYLIRGRICPPNGYLLKYTKSTRAYTWS